MGKGRKPCCDKAGVKKGPWSPAEDFKLMSFIQKHGHNNWRALPKLAGLARCGKSCRLRWVNYLRPDLKRGNFTPGEEEAIIKLHEILGNKWSKIASHFSGRTDNEIKNVWNTHLKKRLKIKGSNNYSTSCNVLSTNNAPTSSNEGLPTTIITTQYVNEVFDECDEDLHFSNEEIRGTTNNDTMAYSSSSSTSYNSITMIENAGGPKDETISKSTEKNKHDSPDEPIEIPYEPNLDLWDLLHGESSEIHQFKDVNTPIISEIDIKNGNIDQDSESWWWLVYLENELGLDHQNESTPLQSSNNVTSTHDLSSDIFSSSKFT